jgi:hypothetical protein
METDENYKRITITLPPDLAKWVKEKESSLNKKDRRLRTSVSAIIADAVAEMRMREQKGLTAISPWITNEDEGNAESQSHSGESVLTPRKTSDGGSKTLKIVKYKKGKRAG